MTSMVQTVALGLSEDNTMGLFFGFGSLVLIAIIAAVLIMQFGAAWRARIARNDAEELRQLCQRYESLVTKVTANEAENAATLNTIMQRVDGMERLLKTVE